MGNAIDFTASVAEALQARRTVTDEIYAFFVTRTAARRGLALPGLLIGHATEPHVLLPFLARIPLWAVMHCAEHIEVRAENGVWTLKQLF